MLLKYSFATRFSILSIFLFSSFLGLNAQNQDQKSHVVRVIRTNSPLTLDGELNEEIWQRTVPADNFWQNFPTDSLPAKARTEVHMAFDDENLYIGVICYSKGGNYITGSLKRDYRASTGDNITLVFDPFKDQTNAFVFGINPFGVRREALISGGGLEREDFNTSWDNKWDGEAKMFDDRWTAEMVIPFKTLRFREGSTEWYFNTYRFDSQENERAIWVPIPQNRLVMDRAYNGLMIWDEPLGKPGANVSLIPYALAGVTKNYEEDTPSKGTWNIGGDAKIAVTPSLNLDLTINPDFSQVEVDDQVTNLDRFEIFFPEKRQFFLENSDLFANLGTETIRPFFSRRIGVAQDSATGQNVQNTIFYGARLSGKLNDNWRVGLLNMQTGAIDGSADPAFNYTVATLQRQVFGRSFVSAFVVNKQAFSNPTGEFERNTELYNRVMGVDYNLASNNNYWQGKIFLHRSFSSDGPDQENTGGIAQGAQLNYIRKNYSVGVEQNWVDEDYEAQTGFVRRQGFLRLVPEAKLFIYPKKGAINIYSPGVKLELFTDQNIFVTDRITSFTQDFSFANNARMQINLNHNYIYLRQDDFDPSRSGFNPLERDVAYNYVDLDGFFFSDYRKTLSSLTRFNIGQFYSGWRFGATSSLTYRVQPYGSIGATLGYTYVEIPDPITAEQQKASLFLIGPKIDLTFTRKLFFTTVVQYNSQFDNLNINARVQWRFKPVSDFFIVYTDNYLTSPDGLFVRNRALVAKFTYWLNL